MIHRRYNRKCTPTFNAALISVGLTVAGSLLCTSPARAESWTVCNRSPEELKAVVVYPIGDGRQYASQGWWRLNACGGCATVFSGSLPVKGVFLRAEGASGNVEGANLFCAKRTAFRMPNANVDERTCRSLGGELMAFTMHTISAARFTTTLSGAPNSRTHCID